MDFSGIALSDIGNLATALNELEGFAGVLVVETAPGIIRAVAGPGLDTRHVADLLQGAAARAENAPGRYLDASLVALSGE